MVELRLSSQSLMIFHFFGSLELLFSFQMLVAFELLKLDIVVSILLVQGTVLLEVHVIYRLIIAGTLLSELPHAVIGAHH